MIISVWLTNNLDMIKERIQKKLEQQDTYTLSLGEGKQEQIDLMISTTMKEKLAATVRQISVDQ